MFIGAVLAIATGVAAFQRRSWAQWTGLFVILPLSLLHVLTIPIFPVWSIVGLGLLMISLYGLSASGTVW